MSHEIAKACGEQGLPHGAVHLDITGSTGQSFGCFLAKGITMELTGDANDYVGKGMSGGRIIIKPGPYAESFKAEENVIVGNVCFYGATSGSAFINGVASQRFCVRNSGALAVVEGVGDHGCEYMTGGRTVILGPTGTNFAAGMSGGVAYVYDPTGEFRNGDRVNMELVSLESVHDDAEGAWLQQVISEHTSLTSSAVGGRMLDDWESVRSSFVKVLPDDYKRVLLEQADARGASLSEVLVPPPGEKGSLWA